ncbi:MAG TPA: hypothetical protein VM166_00165 [Gemmatimonadaceae bacterium]|nr:hypothetical protein [Gemmatimonadaceae bacterium]
MARLERALALALLGGTALLGIGAVFHPMLVGDAASQLRIIAATPYWRSLHLAMLAGSALVATGVWVRLIDRRSTVDLREPARGGLIAALAVVTVGVCIQALNIAYMAGSGTHMAALFAEGRTEMSAVFEATHPFGQMVDRLGNLVIALGALVLGWAEWQDASRPRWLAWLAWIAGAFGLICAVYFNEASPLALAAIGLLSMWQVGTAARVLLSR